MLDDHYHRVMLQGHPQLGEPTAPTDLFAFGDAATSPSILVPWWAGEDLRLRFFRPLTSLSHALDHALWRDSPALMHAHSLLWLGLVVWTGAVFYRRITPGPKVAVAGLAAVLFAVDDVHAVPALWLANRSALISLFFSILAVLAHHRRQKEDWRAGVWAAPVALALAMLSAESGLAAGAYLFAYALFLDHGPLRRRLVSLLPCVSVGVVWAAFYQFGGFGASGSGAYVDPGGEPVRFLAAVAERAPLLLLGQFGFPPVDVFAFFSRAATEPARIIAALLVLGIAAFLWSRLRDDAVARFFAFGLVLATLPLCATVPASRLLSPVSFGGSYLVAAVLVEALRTTPAQPVPRWRRAVGRLPIVALAVVHLVLAPLVLATSSRGLENLDGYFTGVAGTLPTDPSQRAVLVNATNFYLVALAPIVQASRGESLPADLLTLATGIYGITYERLGAHILRVRPDGGFLLPPGTAPPGQVASTLSGRYFLQTADQLYRGPEPFTAGQRIERGDVTVEVVTLTEDGRPDIVDFTFETPLEDGRSWLQFIEREGFAPWQPPAVGASTRIPRESPGE